MPPESRFDDENLAEVHLGISERVFVCFPDDKWCWEISLIINFELFFIRTDSVLEKCELQKPDQSRIVLFLIDWIRESVNWYLNSVRSVRLIHFRSTLDGPDNPNWIIVFWKTSEQNLVGTWISQLRIPIYGVQSCSDGPMIVRVRPHQLFLQATSINPAGNREIRLGR